MIDWFSSLSLPGKVALLLLFALAMGIGRAIGHDLMESLLR